MTSFDAIIIGTGQAGSPLARRLAGAGMKVAIAERGRFGGTCINTGCTPTKTLVASAYAVHTARRGADYGFSTGDVTVDMKRVKARKDHVVALSNHGVERSLKTLENCRVYEGHARFLSPRRCRWARTSFNPSGYLSTLADARLFLFPQLLDSTRSSTSRIVR